MATKAELEEKIEGLETDLTKLEAEVSILTDSNKALSVSLEEAVKSASAAKEQAASSVKVKKPAPVKHDHSQDCVILDGVKYKIEREDTAKEIALAVSRRYVREDQTVLVINRTGSK